MTEDESFQQALREQPQDLSLRLIYADWLEERGDPRGELLQMLHTLTQSPAVPNRAAKEKRLRVLRAAGVPPVGPFVTNSLGMEFAWIAPGRFQMGSPPGEAERGDNETQHGVTLTKGFYLGVPLVTQAQWQQIMGSNPSHFKGDNRPVDSVSWEDCHEFCEKLSQLDGKAYRLPTEAEWEYACRAGTTTPFFFGDTLSTDQANYNGKDIYGPGKKGKYRQRTTPVDNFPANTWGLHDMHGNLWEWCRDWYGPYPTGDVEDPQGQQGGEGRVLRGGSWVDCPKFCRAACRIRDAPGCRGLYFGVRVVLCLD